MQTRREFMGAVGAAAVLKTSAVSIAEELAGAAGQPEQIARDESYWATVQRAFTVDRSIINLNNGGVSPSPAFVQDAMRRHLEYSNQCPPHTMWRVLGPQRETVRARLAQMHGVDAEEIAITRNASEGLQICQFGLDLKPGDEVLTTTQDYHRMIATFRQRERRDGIVLRQFSIPVPAEDSTQIVDLFEANITDRTKAILMCHMINLTGQIMPVRAVVAKARRRGIPVFVDGAHALHHIDFKLSTLNCDFYSTSLHKWTFAPHGTGMLYVHRDQIESLWPLMAAPERMARDIRKFEEIGTHPVANALAIADALTFHEGIGGARKQERLIYLRERWMDRLAQHDRVRFLTSRRRGWACGIANFAVDGLAAKEIEKAMWKDHRILVTAVEHPECTGVRVSPSVYTTLNEIDRFCDVMDTLIA